MAGVPRVPVAHKIARGNPGRRKHEITNKPVFQEGEFNMLPPDDLTVVGKAKWDELAPMLYHAGVLSQGDYNILAQFCRYWEISMSCFEDQRKFGSTLFVGKEKTPTVAPWTKTLLALAPIMERHLTHFGMSPTARGKVTVLEKDKNDDPLERFFK